MRNRSNAKHDATCLTITMPLMVLNLTIEETRLLRELCDGVHSICGNKRARGLNRLVDAKYVESHASRFDAVRYTIPALGRRALAVATRAIGSGGGPVA